MKKTRLVLQRLWQMVPVLIGVSLITFILAQATPGDPARLIVGPRAPESVVDEVRARYGLDKPILVQYASYLGNLGKGDWGDSIAFRTPVLGLILSRLPTTLYVAFGGLLLSVIIALVLSVIAALRPFGMVDQAVRFIATIGLGLPAYWLGIIFVLVFSVRLRWFPASGVGTSTADTVRHLVLPWFTIAIVMAPILIRNLRASLLETLQADFVVAERSKGLPERSIFLRHVLPNSLLTNLHLLGVVALYTLGLAIIIEPVFAVPGLGGLYLGSIISRDYFVIQGLTLVFAFLTILVMLVVDLLSYVVDPRIG
jgi:peptide/nickel transport system permease protein